MFNVYLIFHKLLHTLILVLLEDGSNLGDEPFVDGDADDCQRYAGDKPCRLTEEMIDGTDASQREEKGNGIKIDLQIRSLHAEHGSLEYLQTGREECCRQIKEIDEYCQTETADKHLDSDSCLQERNGRVSNKATALTTI